MGKKNKRSQDESELELEPELTKIIVGDSKKKKNKNKKKRSHEDTEIEPEQKMSLDGDSKEEKKKKKRKKKKNQEEEPELVTEKTKIQEEEKGNVEEGRATVSIAIAGSIIHNTQSLELATRVISLSLYLSLCFSVFDSHIILSLLLPFLTCLSSPAKLLVQPQFSESTRYVIPLLSIHRACKTSSCCIKTTQC